MTFSAVGIEDTHRLVERAKAGDPSAFGSLVQRHQHEVYTLAVRLVGGDHALAEDVAQESFIRAWKALPRFRGDAALSTWLHRITVNTAHTHRAARHGSRRLPWSWCRMSSISSKDSDPQMHTENLGLRTVLTEALASLKEDQRTVVILKDVEGWSHGEIAETLDITIGAAKVRLHRGRKRLRDRLEEVGF